MNGEQKDVQTSFPYDANQLPFVTIDITCELSVIT